ncbi:calcium/sodium antiporter [Tissierella sp. MSJ-40]|uniref:Calcium/sodium antiporter n=1 Tax=Tissierella simiarum TaxID=2841534 RepID=A0ABS6E4Z5_9FIRM|nr:calcium/sodium antiporter [Tissierella simiarum]MBU5437985.1 calcium/sodium antiporter [Tissierella simiarum]
MEISMVFIMFFIGLLITVKGGDLFVDAAVWIAEKTGISPVIIGATIVSLATTLPELFVSAIASIEGHSDVSVGNAIGSYICNIGFIIGVCALIKPMKIESKYFGARGIMMLGYLVVFYVLALDGVITSKEGMALLSLIIWFIIINIIEHKKKNYKKIINNNINNRDNRELVTNLLKFIFGALLILVGAHIMVDKGVEIANILRIPKQIISLTLIALGTSFPELVTSISSIVKDKQNLSIGNIIGANILNLTIVMGISAIVSQQGLIINRQSLFLDVPVAFLISSVFVLAGTYKRKIGRITGAIILILYFSYLMILL